MDTETICRNALRLWHIMNDGSVWSHDKLRQKSMLSESEIYTAIGWLAREESIELIPNTANGKDSYKVHHVWDMEAY